MDKREQAQKIVTNHVLWAMGGGLIPIPLADLSAITAIELDMLSKLAELYEVDFERGSGKNFISAMTGTTLAVFGASLIKTLPGFGSLLGGLTLSVAAGASTYAIGQLATNQFVEGKNLWDIDIDIAREQFDSLYEEGKKFAEDLKMAQEEEIEVEYAQPADAAASDDVFGRIEKLNTLRKRGAITEAEYQAKKAELLARI